MKSERKKKKKKKIVLKVMKCFNWIPASASIDD